MNVEINTKAMLAVIAERERQVSEEGWTTEHDDQEHTPGDLAYAGACYAINAASWLERGSPRHLRERYRELSTPKYHWPWDAEWWKPKNERRDLIRAAALIIAEIERIDRSDAGREVAGRVAP